MCYTPSAMSSTPISIDINSISSNKDLLQLAEEVKNTQTPRALTKDDETLAVLMPVGAVGISAEGDIFAALSENDAFIQEAESASQQLASQPSHFINLTEKYSHLIKSNE